jgi:hypothetical protein
MTARRIVLLLGTMVATLALLTPAAFGVGDPEVHHSGTFWAWDAPASFVGSESANGITITGANGATLDTGFSSILCANGATWDNSVTNYFASKRRGLRNTGFTLSNVSNIAHPAGTPTLYRRQRMNFTVQSGATVKKGEFTFDYNFNTNVDGVNYCFARNLGIYSNRAKFATLRPTLVNINNSLVYFGPGACTPSPSTPC